MPSSWTELALFAGIHYARATIPGEGEDDLKEAPIRRDWCAEEVVALFEDLGLSAQTA